MDDLQSSDKITGGREDGVIPSLEKTSESLPKKSGLKVDIFAVGNLEDLALVQFLKEFATAMKDLIEMKKQIGYLMGYAHEVDERLKALEGGSHGRGRKKGKEEKGTSG